MRRPSFLSARQRASALLFASVAAILLYAVRPADAAGPTADPASVTATSSAGSASASSTTTRPPAVYVPPLALPASTPPDPEVLARLAALPNAGLAGELANVAVSSPRVTALSDQRDSLVSSRKAASVAQSAAESRLVTLDNEFLRLTDERGVQQVAAVTADGLEVQALAEAGLFAEQATRVARFMDDVVVASYVAAGRFESPLQASAFTVAGRRENYSRDVLETKRKERARLVADQAAMDLRALGQAAFATRARRAIAVLDQSLAENRTSVRTSFEEIGRASCRERV